MTTAALKPFKIISHLSPTTEHYPHHFVLLPAATLMEHVRNPHISMDIFHKKIAEFLRVLWISGIELSYSNSSFSTGTPVKSYAFERGWLCSFLFKISASNSHSGKEFRTLNNPACPAALVANFICMHSQQSSSQSELSSFYSHRAQCTSQNSSSPRHLFTRFLKNLTLGRVQILIAVPERRCGPVNGTNWLTPRYTGTCRMPGRARLSEYMPPRGASSSPCTYPQWTLPIWHIREISDLFIVHKGENLNIFC